MSARPTASRLALAVTVFLAAAPVLAEETTPGRSAAEPAPPAAEPGGGRTLNGHRFLPTAAVSQPFVVTSFGSFLIAGAGTTTGTFDVGQQTFSGSFDYAGIGGVLSYEQRVSEAFALRAALADIIYSGIDGRSALAIGTEVQLGGQIGATYSWLLSDDLRAGVLLDVGYQPSLALTIASGLSTIVNDCEAGDCTVDPGSLFGSTHVLTATPAIAVSWAPSSSWGLNAAGGYVYASSSGQVDATGGALQLGLAVDYDFLPGTKVPVGVQLQSSWTAPVTGDALQSTVDVGGGVFYTGRKDMSAGAQFILRRFRVRPEVDVSWSTMLMSIGLRYYW